MVSIQLKAATVSCDQYEHEALVGLVQVLQEELGQFGNSNNTFTSHGTVILSTTSPQRRTHTAGLHPGEPATSIDRSCLPK